MEQQLSRWSEYFEDKTIKTAFKGITQMHHFTFDNNFPKVKSHNDGFERTFNLLKLWSWCPEPWELPDEIVPPAEQQWYLHEKIREFVPTEEQDIVCPKPAVPKP